jgi:hypothetical protein
LGERPPTSFLQSEKQGLILLDPQLLLTGVAVEKGTKAVISVNFSVYGRRTFNNLRTNFAVEIP